MANMYGVIEDLCAQRNMKVGKLCAELGMRRSVLSDLKAGRTKTLSVATTARIADYFGVSTDYLLGTETEKAPTPQGERSVSDDDLKFALWGDAADIDDADLEDVKRYAAFVRERKKNK